MLKAWRAHQAEVRRREEAGELPFKTIEDFRVEIPDALRDAPEPEPKAADSTESEVPKGVRKVSDAQAVFPAWMFPTGGGAGVGGDRSAKVPRVKISGREYSPSSGSAGGAAAAAAAAAAIGVR